jgi:hypothetical protein
MAPEAVPPRETVTDWWGGEMLSRMTLHRDRIAGLLLVAAVAVILIAPVVIGEPNPLAGPAALVAAVGAVCAWSGGSVGRKVSIAICIAGFVFSAVWLGFASSGFGKGVAWWDDMLEAGILAACFLVSAVLLWPRRSAFRDI